MPVRRVTVNLALAIDRNIETLAKREGRAKKKVVDSALAWYLYDDSLRPGNQLRLISKRPQELVIGHATLLLPEELDAKAGELADQKGWIKSRLIEDGLASYLHDLKGFADPYSITH